MPMRTVLLLLFLWLPTAVSAQESVGMWYVQPGGEAIASGISSGPVPNLPGRGYFHLTNTLTLSRKVPQPGVRVTAPDTPVPYSPPLEEAYLPGRDDVLEAARKLLGY